jgi:hypothetical protein
MRDLAISARLKSDSHRTAGKPGLNGVGEPFVSAIWRYGVVTTYTAATSQLRKSSLTASHSLRSSPSAPAPEPRAAHRKGPDCCVMQ